MRAIFIAYCCFPVVILGTPIIIDNFEDKWDYRIKPQDEPLLAPNQKYRDLPPFRRNSEPFLAKEFVKQKAALGTNAQIGDAVRRRISCSVCKLGVFLLQNEVKQATPKPLLKEKFVSICVQFNIENEVVCSGTFDVFAPHVLPVLNMTQISTSQICGLILGEVCGDVDIPIHNWKIQLPDVPKPVLKERLDYQENAPVLKVLHLSDTHLDPNYEEGSPANCQEPLCCHSYSTPSANETTVPAGKWGSYNKCDSPRILIDHMLKHIAEEHKDVDYIIWTGDLPPHDVWNQTKKDNLYILKEAVKQMVEAFPGIPIFPALGNHEGVPAGSFAPPWLIDEDVSTGWLYSELSRQWSKWLPSSTNNTVFHGAFYSVLLRPGFRLISLNTNYCISVNWWLVLNSTDPARQLRWLIYELQQAEDNGEKVHIIGHVPPGDSDCLKAWSENYNKIIDRYEQTIVAQFFGHRHTDEFEVFYDTETYKRPINVAYLGPSITTFENENPGYRIYYVDGDHNETTRDVLDHETWVTNLEKANMPGSEPEWYKLYTAREAYGLQSLRPEEWSKLIDIMTSNSDLFNLFYRYYYKDSHFRPPCDDNQCKLQLLCDLKSARSQFRRQLCKYLEELFIKQ